MSYGRNQPPSRRSSRGSPLVSAPNHAVTLGPRALFFDASSSTSVVTITVDLPSSFGHSVQRVTKSEPTNFFEHLTMAQDNLTIADYSIGSMLVQLDTKTDIADKHFILKDKYNGVLNSKPSSGLKFQGATCSTPTIHICHICQSSGPRLTLEPKQDHL